MTATLSNRFLTPTGWRTHSFVNAETGHKILYGSVYPQSDMPPSAIIVCLGGLSEFMEKYYELAHDMLDRGYAFWIIDWHYQGRSGRLPKYPQRRHSDGFDKDVSDLYKLVSDYIKPAAVHPDRGRIPMIMIGHSMGANIGLRFLAAHPSYFAGAAFTCPLLGIYRFSWKLNLLATVLTPFMFLIGKKYIFGGKDWSEKSRMSNGTDKFSTDPARDAIHNYWSKSDSALQIGSPTFEWVIQALKSCAFLKKPGVLESIDIPVLIAIAGKDQIVDNNAIREQQKRLSKSTLIELDGANHEILMESDEYRGAFLKAFDKMVEQNKIASIENLKPF